MALDSSFCLAYDRKPVSFRHPGHAAPSQPADRPFHDLMHDLQELRLEWQTTSSAEPFRLLESATLEYYLNAVEAIERRAAESIGKEQQATQIPARIEQLFYQLHMSYFTAQIYRLAALSFSMATSDRLEALEKMKAGLHSVISSFMTLKQLSAVPNVAWDVQQATMASALILAGLDRALETTESQELLEKFARMLPHCSDSVAEEETEKMMEASYCHGLSAIKFILNATRQSASTSTTTTTTA